MTGSAPGNGTIRVAHVVLSLNPGGTETLVVDLVKRMSRTLDVQVCCLDSAGVRAGELSAAGIAVDVVGRRPGVDLRVAARLRDIARARRLDVLHCHQYSPFVYGSLAALTLRHLSVVFTEHGRLSDAPPSRRRRVANLIFGRIPARMFAVSENLRQSMVAEGFSARRIEVVHNGIDPGVAPDALERRNARSALRLPDTGFVLGTAARLDPVKDLDTLLHALALLRGEVDGARLIVFGEGSARPFLEQRARDYGIADDVRFLGYRQDVRALLPGLDVYMNSSISEGISVTILEAMAAELPVVATAVGGTPEVVVDGVTGLLVSPRSPEALAGAVLRLARDRQRRQELATAGRQRVIADFSAERMTSRYLDAYQALARDFR